MKSLASWNVNGIRAAAKKGLYTWMERSTHDVVCLQETKAHPEQLTEEHLEPPGYHAYWSSAEKRGYSGVVVYSREEPLSVETLGIPEYDAEGRVLILEYPGFVLINAYFPNSQEGGARLSYKLGFCESLHERCDQLVGRGRHVVICGDFNIAHRPIDLENPAANEANPGYLPEERAWMDRFSSGGYVDGFRLFSNEPKQYTWWSYRLNARARNIGWRIDYHWFDRGFIPSVKGAGIHAEVLGSDHCPISLTVDA
ncbi:exodeoxyribonuclease III [Salinispira pacifica]